MSVPNRFNRAWIVMATTLLVVFELLMGGSGERRPHVGWVGAASAAPGVETAPGQDTTQCAPPTWLSQTGLYAADGSIDPRNLPYLPQYPLWTDGALKSRWIRLPEQARIDVSDIDAWRFPAGTILWKEFAFGGRKVETRMMMKTAGEGWVFAAYAWNTDQTDARLVPAEGLAEIYEVAPGRRHSIPGLGDCANCHESSPGRVLGFSALQLSDDRDPLAPHAEPLRPGMLTLRGLIDADRLAPARPELARHPPRIRAADPTARAALGYLSGNCGSCHNATGPLARLGLDLLHRVAGEDRGEEPAVRTTIDIPGRYVVPGVAPDSSRLVVPGAPERSALFFRLHSRRPSSQMPPLGTRLVDEEAVRLVERWIASLAPRSDSLVSAR